MNKENEKKIKGVKKLQAREGNIFLMLILLLHIHDVCLPRKSMCDPTSSNGDPFMACGKVAQSLRAAVHLLEGEKHAV